MFDKLKSKVKKEEVAVPVVDTHAILFVKIEDDNTVHILKCPAILDNPLRIITIEDRHFFFCPICGKKLADTEFIDAVAEKARRDEELAAIYCMG